MDAIQLKICDIQGRLFELFSKSEYDAKELIKIFMNSALAVNLDSVYNRMQWAGEEYLYEELTAINKNLPLKAENYPKEVLFWMGYVYRYWHYYTGESSKKIYKQAPFDTMNTNYLMFHTMDAAMAVDDLKEIYKQKHF